MSQTIHGRTPAELDRAIRVAMLGSDESEIDRVTRAAHHGTPDCLICLASPASFICTHAAEVVCDICRPARVLAALAAGQPLPGTENQGAIAYLRQTGLLDGDVVTDYGHAQLGLIAA